MAAPLISVVIPTYGRPQYLPDALESVKAQSYTSWECIVVDDCSPEPVSTPEWVRLIRHRRNMGPGAARNTGLAHAAGDLIMFLDDDDWLDPDRLQWAVDELGGNRAHFCFMSVVADGAERRPTSRELAGTVPVLYQQVRAPHFGSVVFRVEDVVQFDPALRFSEDVEWWMRMQHAANFAIHPGVGYYYRSHNDPRPGESGDTRYMNRRILYLRHGTSRAARAYHARRVSAAALTAGRRWTAARWAARAMIQRPSVPAMRLARRAVIG